MMMQSSRKPPLPRSPIHLRLRPRRPLQSTSTNIQTPTGSSVKAQLPKSACDVEGCEIRQEYRTISCELRALAKMVHQEFSSSSAEWGGGDDDARLVSSSLSANRSPLFERGRFYEEYSARRNERLKRKKAAVAGHDHLGVRVESAKRRDTSNSKRFESLRKTVPCTPMVDRIQAAPPPPSSSRYLLRSRSVSKENKKLPSAVNGERSSGIGENKIGVRRARKI